MTADEDDYLLGYLNRVSLQVIAWLDGGARLDGGGRGQPTTKASVDKSQAAVIRVKSSSKPARRARQRKLSQTVTDFKQASKDSAREQPAKKITRARGGNQQQQQQQQQRQTKRPKTQHETGGEFKEQTFDQPFKALDDDKTNNELDRQEQQLQLQLSTCLQDHEHYMGAGANHNPHHNQQQHLGHHAHHLHHHQQHHHQLHHHHHQPQATGSETMIQLDGNGHLSSVSLLSLTMGDELGQHLDSHQVVATQNGCGDLLASHAANHLSPIDSTIAQLNAASGSLAAGAGLHASGNYYSPGAPYDDFAIGHETNQVTTIGTTNLNDNSSSSLTAQHYASHPHHHHPHHHNHHHHHHQHPAADSLGQSLADCYSTHNHHGQQHLHHQHHPHPHQSEHQVHQQIQSMTVHHHYQPHLSQQHVQFDHRSQPHGEHQQWLSPLIVDCSNSPAQATLEQHQHNQHANQQQQQQQQQQPPLDQHNINYATPHQAYQQQQPRSDYLHYSATTLADSHSFQEQQQLTVSNIDEFISSSAPTTATTTTTATRATTPAPNRTTPTTTTTAAATTTTTTTTITSTQTNSANASGETAGLNQRGQAAAFEQQKLSQQQTDQTDDQTNSGNVGQTGNNDTSGGLHEIHTSISASSTPLPNHANTLHQAYHVIEHHHHQQVAGHHHHHERDHHSQDQHHQHHQQQEQASLHHLAHQNHHHHHMMQHQLHPGHLMPPLGPLVNGIEPSSVILHDINLASASWSSSEDLYSI
jgi:hypothetical protein